MMPPFARHAQLCSLIEDITSTSLPLIKLARNIGDGSGRLEELPDALRTRQPTVGNDAGTLMDF